jgi:ubiquinone biosynthesis protein
MRLLAIALTGVLIVLSVVAIVGGFALLARRLLGLRFGMVRLLVAGLLAFAVAGPIARAVSGPLPATGGAAAPVWLAILIGACALVVEQVLAAELDGQVFASFDRRPLAAASVAQVHAARLRSGAEVVVKVQRPGIREVVARHSTAR